MSKFVIGVLIAIATAGAARAHAAGCDDLLELILPDIRITSTQHVPEPVPHCKASGLIGRNIGFSVWLPDTWNGRFVMGGAGGFVRREDNQALRFLGDSVLHQGYATASTDTGHRGGGQESNWARNNLEAIVNYGHLAMHRAVTASKEVIASHYAKAAQKSFFIGCSNGGRQALHEAQRYPNDFDAIIAGAPALHFTGVAASFLNVVQHMFPNPQNLTAALVTPTDRRLLRNAIEAKCDAADGLRDGMQQDPSACDFDVASLSCNDKRTHQCLSEDKLAAVRAVYDGPRDNTGPLHFGFPFGAEDIEDNGWGAWLTGGAEQGSPNAAYNFGVGMMRNFVYHDADWDYRGFDWDTFRSRTAPLAAVLDANDPDLSAFREQGGKLLMYHGWADVALSAYMSTDYVERVYAFDHSARDDVRLFMMPGVLHCYGGSGPSVVDWLEVLSTWHDSGQPPDALNASYPDKSGQRRLCAWPRKAQYTGGDPDRPDAYHCR